MIVSGTAFLATSILYCSFFFLFCVGFVFKAPEINRRTINDIEGCTATDRITNNKHLHFQSVAFSSPFLYVIWQKPQKILFYMFLRNISALRR